MPDAHTAPISYWSGPGIIQGFITIPKSSKLSPEIFEKWFDEVYVPDLLATGIVISSWRFKAADPKYGKPKMFIHKCPDLSPVQAGKLHEVKIASDMFPTNGSVYDFIESETNIFSLVQLYETVKQHEDAATTVIMAAMEPSPGGEAELDAWYREEHNQQMSEQPGWKRTTRFNLLLHHKSDGKPTEPLSFLAIHEFGEGHKIGKDVVPLDPMTDWTKKCMAEARVIDAAVYTKVKTFGEAAASS
ncbi:uncharacterized protein BDR25DRAFT_345234 [Lindgomyces ingoldianus]|uniref:Uncharacterized protein n=1 Tax=Lindgomyces ingoldianus TaxID=673940 RepID=A0ACB6QJJ3_9PLEO|nr:uncharacterized protein BDR25DRAFT_345234 [Lindgomyces ingoldianus]KAF2467070.1 hypothetical protein BDR25DRAFT_345234 [Lindgomyces ingoldianus]